MSMGAKETFGSICRIGRNLLTSGKRKPISAVVTRLVPLSQTSSRSFKPAATRYVPYSGQDSIPFFCTGHSYHTLSKSQYDPPPNCVRIPN